METAIGGNILVHVFVVPAVSVSSTASALPPASYHFNIPHSVAGWVTHSLRHRVLVPSALMSSASGNFIGIEHPYLVPRESILVSGLPHVQHTLLREVQWYFWSAIELVINIKPVIVLIPVPLPAWCACRMPCNWCCSPASADHVFLGWTRPGLAGLQQTLGAHYPHDYSVKRL